MVPEMRDLDEVLRENEELSRRLREAEETLEAIRSGAVDALVVSTPEGGEKLFTLESADAAYRVFLESIAEGALTLSGDGVILYANEAAARMLSFKTGTALGEPLRSAVRRVDRPRFDMLFEAALHQPAAAEIRLRGPLRGRHVNASFRPLESETDTVIVAVLTDLTERKKTEKALEAERLANSILEQTSEAILVCDTAGMIIRSSRSVKDLTQRGPLFQRFDDVLELSTPDGARWLLSDHLRETEPVRRQEVKLLRHDGAASDLLMSVDPLWTCEDGPLGVVITLTDVTTLKTIENALREGEEKYRTLFQDMEEGFGLGELLRDEQGQVFDHRYLELNPAFERLTGLRVDDVLGRPVTTEIYPGLDDMWTRSFARAVETDEPVHFEQFNEQLGRWYKVTVLPRGRDRFAVLYDDISDRKRAEEALRASEQRLLEAQHVAHIGSWEWDIESGKVAWSPELYAIYGLDPDHFSPTIESFAAYVHPHDRELVDKVIERVFNGERAEFDFRIIAADGAVHVLHTTGEVTETDRDGRPRVMVGVNEDVTERRRVAEALRRQAEMLDLSFDAIFVRRLGGEIESWNRGAEELYGFSKGEALGQVSHDLLSTIHQRHWQQIEETLREHGSWEGEVRHRTKDGREVVVSSRHQLIRGDDGNDHVLETNRDITEYKRAQEAERRANAEKAAEEERSRLARDLHDSVTQALFAATLKADALTIEGMVSDKARAVVEDVARLNRAALAQMRTMLLELRGQAIQEVPIGQLLRTVAEATEGRSNVRVNFSIEGEGRLTEALHVAVYRITQEALNNVARHAQAENVWVNLTMTESLVSLVVEDDGRGFEPGAVDPSHMGLASMEERAREADAQLLISTALGEGTTLTLSWRPPSTDV